MRILFFFLFWTLEGKYLDGSYFHGAAYIRTLAKITKQRGETRVLSFVCLSICQDIKAVLWQLMVLFYGSIGDRRGRPTPSACRITPLLLLSEETIFYPDSTYQRPLIRFLGSPSKVVKNRKNKTSKEKKKKRQWQPENRLYHHHHLAYLFEIGINFKCQLIKFCWGWFKLRDVISYNVNIWHTSKVFSYFFSSFFSTFSLSLSS